MVLHASEMGRMNEVEDSEVRVEFCIRQVRILSEGFCSVETHRVIKHALTYKKYY